MFVCPRCKFIMNLPKCEKCRFSFENYENIWRLSDMPDVVTTGESDKYIGYEFIGENYSGNRKYIINESDYIIAKEIARLTDNGVFLDLACGDGCFTVPCASFGTKIIAGDISNTMLKLLMQKAEWNNISLNNVTICRMNALDVPLRNESVTSVVANSVLHLISNPKKVVNEIHRILETDGYFICKDDKPGKAMKTVFDNDEYNNIVNTLYTDYWKQLGKYGVVPRKYSWKFDRNSYCDLLFKSKETILIEREKEYEIPLKDGFLPRFLSRGFSDQVEVPKELHDKVTGELLEQLKERHGENFTDISFKGIEEDILLTIYKK